VGVFLSRGSGDKLFEEAENAYREQSYTAAIKIYEKFYSGHSGHPKASFARVRHGLAHIRFPLEVEQNLEEALSEAQRVLPLVADETAFDQARSELTSILPDIADGFAQRAQEAKDTQGKRKWLALTRQALDLVNNPAYLPTSAREGVQGRVDTIQKAVDGVDKFLRREKRLVETVKAIQEAVKKGETDKAYEARADFLKDYPTLALRTELHQAVLSITAKMGEKVRVGPSQASALTNDRAMPEGRSVLLAARQGDPAPGLENHVLYLIASGAAYAINAHDGRVLWRRFVDFHPDTRIDPVSSETGADALLLDASHRELLRLAAADGKLIWRLPLGTDVRGARRIGEHLVVADEAGRVLLVDPESGKPTLEAFLPQGIATSVGVTGDGKTLLVVGDHSNLYLLAADTLACQAVVYLGQEPETVQVPPVECLGRLLVFENSGLDFARLHVFAPDDEGEGWRPAQKPLQVQHNIVVEPVVTGPHVICLTDHGALNVFEMSPTEADQPLREVANTQVSTREVVAGAMLYENGHLWVADVQLTRYRVNLALGQIERTWVDHQGDTFLGWLANHDRVIFHARRPRGLAGTTVASLQIAGGGTAERAISPLWSADLGVAPAGPPLFDQDKQGFVSVSISGDAFSIDAAAIQSGRCTEPVFRLGPQIPRFAASPALPIGGRMVFPQRDGLARWLIFDPAATGTPFRLVQHGDRDTKWTAAPAAFGKTLLLPLDNGQVHAVDPATGESMTHPFQPPLQPDQTVTWRSPCVLAAEKQFVIADVEGNLHRVGIEPSSPPMLKSLASGRAAGAVRSPLAATTGAVFAVIDLGDREALAAFHRQNLETVVTVDLVGRSAMGPAPLGDSIVLATDQEGLLGFDKTGDKLWTVPLDGELPAGVPAAVEGGFVLATTQGRILRLGSDGKTLADIDSGEPITYGPLVQGSNLLVSGPDGTLRVLPIPAVPNAEEEDPPTD
jgi:outer membrane protein assembly factor BamB